MLSISPFQDVHVRNAAASVHAEKSVEQRTRLARTNRARQVRPVYVASSDDNSRSADVSDTLTSFFLLETPLPSLKGYVFRYTLLFFDALNCLFPTESTKSVHREFMEQRLS